MKSLTLNIRLMIFTLFIPFIAWAQEIKAPEQLEDLGGYIPIIIEAFKNGQWLMFGSLIALVATFAVKKYVFPKLKLGSGLLPIVSAVIGVIGGVGLAIANKAEPAEAALAVMSGPLASTLWDAILKYFFKKE